MKEAEKHNITEKDLAMEIMAALHMLVIKSHMNWNLSYRHS